MHLKKRLGDQLTTVSLGTGMNHHPALLISTF
jgi:hypothetical protein